MAYCKSATLQKSEIQFMLCSEEKREGTFRPTSCIPRLFVLRCYPMIIIN